MTFERQCQYSSFVSYNDRAPPSPPSPPLPSHLPNIIHMTLPGLPPLFLHTASAHKTGGGNGLGTRLVLWMFVPQVPNIADLFGRTREVVAAYEIPKGSSGPPPPSPPAQDSNSEKNK